MLCPSCNSESSRVIDSRTVHNGASIKRRRECSSCSTRFTTLERCILLVTKRNGVSEEFSRDKLIQGVRRACQGRKVSDDSLKLLAHQVEQTLRVKYGSNVQANDIGLAVLEPLRALDEVAYLRFASVYKSFSSAEDFLREIDRLREKPETTEPAM